MIRRWPLLAFALLACCRPPAASPAQDIRDPKAALAPEQEQDDEKTKQVFIGNLRHESMQSYGRPASRLLGMLNAKAVSRDLRANQLEITEEQNQRILQVDRLARSARQRSLAQDIQLVQLAEPERSLKLKEGEQRRKNIANDADQIVLKGILAPAQAARLQQIRWQSNPTVSLVEDPELGRLLNLTDKQKREIEARWKGAQDAIRNPPEELRGLNALRKSSDDAAVNQEIDAVTANFSKQAHNTVYAVLSPSQQERFRRLMGPRWTGAR